MKKVTLTQKIALVGSGLAALASNAAAAVAVPEIGEVDMASAELAAGLAILVFVGVLMMKKAVSFFRS